MELLELINAEIKFGLGVLREKRYIKLFNSCHTLYNTNVYVLYLLILRQSLNKLFTLHILWNVNMLTRGRYA